MRLNELAEYLGKYNGHTKVNGYMPAAKMNKMLIANSVT